MDLIYGNVSERAQHWIDIFGIVVFLLPSTILFTWLSWESLFLPSWRILEQSGNSGGLPRYPIKLVVPIGFALLYAAGHFRADQAGFSRPCAGLVRIESKYERPMQ